MSDETTIYVTDGVVITNLRAVFGSKTFAVSHIASVEKKEAIHSGCGPFVLVGIGLLFAISGLGAIGETDSWPMTVLIGVVVFFWGVSVSSKSKPTYLVYLSTADGEIKAFESPDEATIKAIVDALNDAIIKKG